jgi:hypothetical protein
MGPDARPTGKPPIVEDSTSGTASATAGGERDPKFWLALSPGQVQDLVQQEAASRGGSRGLMWVVLALNDVGERISMEELASDERYQSGRVSQSTIISLVVLGAFASGKARGVKSLADELGISASTTWRYLNTWKTLCVLEERKDRRYQLATRWTRELPKTARASSADRAK